MFQPLTLPLYVMTDIQELMEIAELQSKFLGITDRIFVFELFEPEAEMVNEVVYMAMTLFDAKVRLN